MTRISRTTVLVLTSLGLALTTACAPNTIIRRTAFINAPQAPAREGQPLEKGDVRLQAHLSGVNTAHGGDYFRFEPGFAEVGDPGVLIPDFQLGASVWAGLPGGLEFGGQLSYAAMEWSDPNVEGVLPFPRGQEEDLLMGGLGLRFNVDVADPRLALGILAEVNVASIPEAIFVCTDEVRCTSDQGSTTFEGFALYSFDRIEHETFFLPNLSLQFGWRFGDVAAEPVAMPGQPAPPPPSPGVSVMPFLSLGLQASVTNTGFEPDFSTLPEDSLETLWLGFIGAGVDAVIEGFVIGGSLLLPIEGEDAIDFGLVFNVRMGAQL